MSSIVTGNFFGAANREDGTTDLNAFEFVARQIVNRISTMTFVQIVAVFPDPTGGGGGTVDVQPLVNQVDGFGNAIPHGVVCNLPYQRIQSGGSAVIMDPTKGDIGLAIFADRDVSSVRVNRAQANPGSYRRFDMADGVYIGGVLNGVPTQFISFTSTGIAITSPTQISLDAPNIVTTGALTNNGHAVGSTHEHTGVQEGDDTSGPPV
jgi:hypothetical protein